MKSTRDNADPRRAKLLIDMDEPNSAKSKIEIDEPKRL
jgi:hypothetical protein